MSETTERQTAERGTTLPRTTELDTSQMSALEEERDFLLRSLEDLEAERTAGDVDDDDYRALKDDYTRRAAGVIRALDRRRVRTAPPAPRRGSRAVGWVLLVAAIGVTAGLLLAHAAGRRESGGTITGETRNTSRQLLADALEAFSAGEYDDAIDLYGEVLALTPSSAEALTYRGWVQFQGKGDTEAAWLDFDEAIAVDATYPDVRVFRAVAFLDQEDADAAAVELAVYDGLDERSPFADQLVDQFQLRERVALSRVTDVLLVADPPSSLTQTDITIDDIRLAVERLVEQGEPVEALTLIDLGLREGDDAGLFALQGWTYGLLSAQTGFTPDQQDEFVAKSTAALDRAVTLDPALPDARLYRAILLLQAGDTVGGEADLDAFCTAPHRSKLDGYLELTGLTCPE